MRLALYQPDIAPNVGTMLRLGACLGVPVDIIEPCGFPFGARDLKRAVMDYAEAADVTRYISWQEFNTNRPRNRLVLLTTRAKTAYTEFKFKDSDILLFGRESAGVPEDVHNTVDHSLCIPMAANMRSINVALSAAMVLGEALRQTGHFPTTLPSVEAVEQP